MNVKPGDLALVVGGGAPEFRPEDIGKECEVIEWIEKGGLIKVPGFESDYNSCDEAAWLVKLYDDSIQGYGIVMKRDAWLIPINGKPELERYVSVVVPIVRAVSA